MTHCLKELLMTSKNLIACLGIVLFLSVSAYAQSAVTEVKHFVGEGISFDYPVGWSISDESTPEAQQFILTKRDSSVRLEIVAKRDFVFRHVLSRAIDNLKEPLLSKVATRVAEGQPPQRTDIRTQVGRIEAEGVRLRATGKSKTTGEVFWFRMHFRLIGMGFVRSDTDESVASQLWQTVRTTLSVEGPVVAAKAAEEPSGNSQIESGVLNGKALELPQPTYPGIARAAHASGTVTVQVIIDEQGNVTAARALSGHPLLQAVCVAAARQARFSPTMLEGEPVKVAGVIKYNFVSR